MGPLETRRRARPGAAFAFRLLAWIGAVLVAAGGRAPAGASEEQAALWLTGQLRVPLDDTFSANLVVQPRFEDDIGELQRVVVRPWLEAALPHRLAVALGYDAQVNLEPRSLLEQRVWQQLAASRELAPLELFARVRLEQRWLEGRDSTAVRARFQLGLDLPLPGSLTARVSNEFFVNLNATSWVPRTGYRENRLFAGLSHPLGRHTRIGTGYQMQWRDLLGPDLIDQTLMLSVSVTTPPLGGG